MPHIVFETRKPRPSCIITCFLFFYLSETIQKFMCFYLLFHLPLLLNNVVVLQKCAFHFSIPVPTSNFNFLNPFCIFDNLGDSRWENGTKMSRTKTSKVMLLDQINFEKLKTLLWNKQIVRNCIFFQNQFILYHITYNLNVKIRVKTF